MEMLEVDGLVKTFETRRGSESEVVAVDHVSFAAPEGAFMTLLGPSGCGKTTTLRSIAGLEVPDQGTIRVSRNTLYSSLEGVNIPANQRGLGMVFQSYAIWPHMNVFQNVAFPLSVTGRRQRWSKSQIAHRVEEVLEVVQLGGLEQRPATDLSGGQQQRLALARALIIEPPLLLLDEPLSNLDAKLREELRFELKRLQRELGITTLYVTHDQTEALAMSNLLAVMNDGRIEQLGTPREVYENPTSAFVAGFIGTSNFIEGVIESPPSDSRYLVKTDSGSLVVKSLASLSNGTPVVVAVRPEHVMLAEGVREPEAAGRWHGRVRQRAFLGEALDYIVDVDATPVRVRSEASLNVSTGADVTLTFQEDRCSLIPQ